MKIKTTLIYCLVAILIFSSGCALLPKEDEKLAPPIKKIREVEYKTMTIEYGTIKREVNLFAQWKAANRIVYMFTEFNAPFLEYHVQVGDKVEPGTLMASLDVGDIDRQIRDMEISFQSAKLSYERVKEKYDAGTASEYNLRLAELDFEDVTNKYNDLLEKRDASRLVSDISGTVQLLMNYEKGSMVYTGTGVVTLVENDDLILSGSSSMLKNSNLTVGYPITIESKGQIVDGIISAISGTVVTVEPNVFLDDWDLGTTVKVNIPLESAENVLLVHRNAIKSIGGRSYVRVLIDGVAIEKYVDIGISSGSYMEVISGLEEGDLVILD